jgi:hypothetical protein
MQGFDNAQVWLLADLYGLGSLLFEIATGQGITAIALGSGADQQERVGRMPSDVRKAHFESQIPDMRGRYETALEIMEAELPRSIAHLTVGLVRQICDPNPERRLPNSARDPRHNQTGLEWLLRRVEIIVKTLETTEARGEEP